MADDLNLVEKLSDDERVLARHRLNALSPDDGKYADTGNELRPYLSEAAEWTTCALVQKVLLETRRRFGKATKADVAELEQALPKIDPLNIALLEKDKRIMHDQLAVIEELGRHVSPRVKALLHPGTTSYDILDTARSYLLKGAWAQVMRPRVKQTLDLLCDFAERNLDVLRVGRTHLQTTSPVLFGGAAAIYAARIADRTLFLDKAFTGLKGKISGIVGTGAGVEAVIGKGKAMEFEIKVLRKLRLRPDYAATQIVQKDSLSDIGHGLVGLAFALGGFAEDIRKLYAPEYGEVTSLDNAARLGGSSAAAGKNNPIQWENIAGTVPIVEGGMRVLYAMLQSDFERDLRGSKQARYQPKAMMAEVHNMFTTAKKAMPQLTVIPENVALNLRRYRDFPDEAMTAILRGHGYVHPEAGEGHSFVKKVARTAKLERKDLFSVAKNDTHFSHFYEELSPAEQRILRGGVEEYLGDAKPRALKNIAFARAV